MLPPHFVPPGKAWRKSQGLIKAVSEGEGRLAHSSVTQSSPNISGRVTKGSKIWLLPLRKVLSNWMLGTDMRKVSKNTRW